MTLARTAIQIPPGVVRRGSEAEIGAAHWYDAQLVRWVEGVMRPIGGWERIILNGATLSGMVRAMHTWTAKNGNVYTGILTDTKLYVLSGNDLTDISPTPPLVAPPSDLTLGGYGDHYYSYDTYGTARPAQQTRRIIGPVFSLDNWGEDLLAMVSTDGRLLRWQPSTPGTAAVVVPNAPTANRTFVVTPERHVILAQPAGEFARFAWCSQEDIENWAYTDVTKTAGYYSIEPAGPIIAMKNSRFGTLIFLPRAVYISRYIGTPYIYSLDYIGSHGVPMTAASVVALADSVLWPAPDGFWMFNGSVISPLDCDVLDYYKRQLNDRFATVRPAGMFLGNQTEVWWFYPSGEATENDRYIVYNYQENWWTIGSLKRTCGVAGSTLTYPYMSDGAAIFRHEYGRFYYDAPTLPYAQSGAINIADGDRQVTATKGIADTRAPAGDVLFSIGTRFNRIMNGTPAMKMTGPYSVRADGKIDFRVTGRDLIIRIQSARNGVEPWTFGKFLCRLAPRGQR